MSEHTHTHTNTDNNILYYTEKNAVEMLWFVCVSILVLALVSMIGAVRMHHLELAECGVQHEQPIDADHDDADAATSLPAGQRERHQRTDEQQQQKHIAVLTERTLASLR